PYGGGVNGSVTVAKRTVPAKKRSVRKCHGHGKKRRCKSVRVVGKSRRAGTLYVEISRTSKFNSCPKGVPCTGPYGAALDQAAGIWRPPAVDAKDKVAFTVAGNPFKPQAEAKHADSILKFDVNRKSRRFGQIIGSYKGNVDTYFPQESKLPCFDIPGNPPPYY